jgi:glycosyltransferase involved in cell wall biosynthesis
VPAYRSADVIARTLQSIADQTYRNIRVVISLDPSDDDTDKACEPFLTDPRFVLIRQEEQLGWTGNTNYLLDQVRSKFFCIIFHDDWIEPTYLARLMRALRREPAAVCTYPTLEHVGRINAHTSVASLIGSRFERTMGFFRQPRNSVPIRGLTRVEVLQQGLRLRELGTGGFVAEWLYTFELAVMGGSKRVGKAHYISHARPDSVSDRWRGWSDNRKRAGWKAVLRTMHGILMRQDFTPEQRLSLLEAALPWAYRLRDWLPASKGELAAIRDPIQCAALARLWAEDPEGNPPFL